MARIPYPASYQGLPSEYAKLRDQLPQNSTIDMLAYTPTVGRLSFLLGQSMLNSLKVGGRDRELVILAVSAITQCEYQWAYHEPMAEQLGIDDGARKAIRAQDLQSDSLTSHDRMVVEFTRNVLVGSHVADTLFEVMQSTFDPREIVEIMQIIGYYWTISRFVNVLDIETPKPAGLAALQAVVKLRGNQA